MPGRLVGGIIPELCIEFPGGPMLFMLLTMLGALGPIIPEEGMFPLGMFMPELGPIMPPEGPIIPLLGGIPMLLLGMPIMLGPYGGILGFIMLPPGCIMLPPISL